MKTEEIYEKLTEIFRDVFDDEDIVLSADTVAGDIEGWDSLTHITLIGTIEDELNVKFAMRDVVGMKNVGEMVHLILEQVQAK